MDEQSLSIKADKFSTIQNKFKNNPKNNNKY